MKVNIKAGMTRWCVHKTYTKHKDTKPYTISHIRRCVLNTHDSPTSLCLRPSPSRMPPRPFPLNKQTSSPRARGRKSKRQHPHSILRRGNWFRAVQISGIFSLFTITGLLCAGNSFFLFLSRKTSLIPRSTLDAENICRIWRLCLDSENACAACFAIRYVN